MIYDIDALLFPNSSRPVVDRAGISGLLKALQDRVLTGDDGAVVEVSDDTTMDEDRALQNVVALAALTLTLAALDDLGANYSFWVYARGGDVTIAAASGDSIEGGSSVTVLDEWSARVVVGPQGWLVLPVPPSVGAGAVPSSRTIAAGAGLTGGGALTANRTFAVDLSGNVNFDADTGKLATRGTIRDFVAAQVPTESEYIQAPYNLTGRSLAAYEVTWDPAKNYQSVEIEGDQLCPSQVDTDILMRFQRGGVWQEGAVYRTVQVGLVQGAVTNIQQQSSSFIQLTHPTYDPGIGENAGFSFTGSIRRPSNVLGVGRIALSSDTLEDINNPPRMSVLSGAGYINGPTAGQPITGVRIYPSAGTFARGFIAVRGVF